MYVNKQTGETFELRALGMNGVGNYDTDQASNESGLKCEDPSLAQQQFKEEVDINTIVNRFGLTGQLPNDLEVPVSGDFTGVFDFQSAMNVVRAAEESFMEMPAHVRARFHNDPGEFLDFVHDDSNRTEAQKLGILAKPPEKTRDVVQAVDELAKHFKESKDELPTSKKPTNAS